MISVLCEHYTDGQEGNGNYFIYDTFSFILLFNDQYIPRSIIQNELV